MRKHLFFVLFFSITLMVKSQCSFTTNIIASGPTVACGGVTLSTAASGNTWTSKANFTGGQRQYAVGFSIGTKGYFGTGSGSSSLYLNDFWEYDPGTNAWTQKANFAGGGRFGAIGFGIGTKGYVGTGYDGNYYKNDFWEYDPVANTWTQKANLGGVGRLLPAGFVINGKGYIGTGNAGSLLGDLWEYNPTVNTWTQKSNFPNGLRYAAIGMAIGNYGYIGSGYPTTTTYTNDFCQYNPLTDTWVQKASIGTVPFYGASAFACVGKGYVTCGFEPGTSTISDKVWEYNPANNTWTQKASLGSANGRYYAAAFAIGNKGYIGTGSGPSNLVNTFWEYEAVGTFSWSNGATTPSIVATSSGNYSVLITAGAGCTASATQSVAVSPNPSLSIISNSLICVGSNNTMIASGAMGYTWSANAGGSNNNSVVVTPTVSTAYTLSASSGSCTLVNPIFVFVSPLPASPISLSSPSVACGTVTLTAGNSGEVWTQKAGISLGRSHAVSFSIGNKAYLGTGRNTNFSPWELGDFWEYDPTSNAWTQKANIGGVARYGAFAFSIGSKGYVGGGSSSYSPYYLLDFWEFDPLANTWTQKANCSTVGRIGGIGFSIGGKGYAGTGLNGSTYLNDFYEYDPSINTWTTKANFPGLGRRAPVGFCIGNKGYIGTGMNGSSLFKDFWEYDPLSNSWTSKAPFGGSARQHAAAFVIGNKAYVGTGIESTIGNTNDFWEYDQSTDTWVQRASVAGSYLGGAYKAYATGFAIGNKGYFATGYSNFAPNHLGSLWQYDPATAVLWSNTSTLSSITATASGNYSVTLTNQFGCSNSYSQALLISPNPAISVSGSLVICAGTSNTLVANGSGTYTWSANAGGVVSNSVVVSPTVSTTYSVSATNGSCTLNYPVQVLVNAFPNYSIAVSGPTMGCAGITMSLAGTGNTWTQKTGMGVGRNSASAFVIGNKAYIGIGYNGTAAPYTLNDFWEYDPYTDVWTQKADFGGGPRHSAAAFAVGSKGYVSTGIDNNQISYNDCWEFDPLANTWIQKANFPGTVRYAAFGMGIGSKGYLGTGVNGTLSTVYFNDFYEFDPQANAWTQKANYGAGVRRNAVAVTIGSKGYVGTGTSTTSLALNNDLWEYDPSVNTWTQKANLTGNPRTYASGFAIGNTIILGTGNDTNSGYTSDFFEYNLSTNSWTQRASLPAGNRSNAIGFAIGGKGYFGTGYNTVFPYHFSDLWQYSPVPTFTWSSSATTPSLPVSTSGLYSVVVTNPIGCSNVISQSVALSPTFAMSFSGQNGVCVGKPSTLVVSGASTYTWSANAGSVQTNTTVISTTAAAVYSVSGTTGFCTMISTVGISPNALPAVVANASSPSVCVGNTVTLSGSGANTYTWNTPYLNNTAFSPGTTAQYSVTGTGTNLCTNTAVVTISVMPLPTISVGNGTICQGQTFTISPAGAITYSYSGGTAAVSPSATNIYSVTGTSSAGCVAVAAALATVYVNPSPTITVNSGSICAGQTFTIAASGANSYTYSGGTSIVSPSVSTNFTVTGSNANGCVNYIPAISTVTVFALPIISAPNGSICLGYSYSINPSGAVTYTYSSGSNVVSPNTNSTFTINGMSAAGCLAASPAIVSITVNSIPVISVNSGTICQGQSFSINPSGANTYTYAGGSSLVSPLNNSTYTVMGTSSAGCVSSVAAIASVAVLPSPTISVSGGSICAGQSFTINPLGANAYTFSSGSAVVSPNSNTTYTVSGSNANGCLNYSPAIITVSAHPLPTITVANGAICIGSAYTITPSGASTFTYSSGSNVVSPTSNSNYSISGTSSVGCLSSNVAVVNVSVNPLPVIAVNSGSICQGTTFTMIPSGANTYTFSGGSAMVNPLINSSYSVTGTSTAGCISAAAAVANVSVLASPTVAVSGGSICAGQNFTLNPTGANNYSYSSGNAIVSPGSTSSYTITGINGSGCFNYLPAIATITVHALPIISASSGSICNGSSFSITPSGASTYTYSGGNSQVSPANTATYGISGTSTAGCISASPAIITVTVNPIPSISVNSGSICSGTSFVLIPSGAASYTISGNSSTVSPVSNNSYTVSGTSLAGCVSTLSAIANVSVLPSPTLIAANGSICNGQTYAINPSGANSYTFSSGSNTVNPVVTNVYTVNGSNNNGCSATSPITVQVTVYPNPTISLPSSASICAGNVYTFNPSGANTYTFSSGSNTVAPLINNTYTVTGTSSAGCLSQTTMTLYVQANLHVSITGTNATCAGNNVTLSANGAASYTWNTGANTYSLLLNPSNSASYSVIGISGVCSDTASFNVLVYPNPTITISQSHSIICAGESCSLTASGANSYTWSTGFIGATLNINPNNNSTYSISGSDGNGCVAINSINQSVDACMGQKTTILQNNDLVNIYPNPNNGRFFVEIPLVNDNMQLLLYNYLGELIFKSTNLQTLMELEFTQAANGMYTLMLVKDGKVLTAHKLIKQ